MPCSPTHSALSPAMSHSETAESLLAWKRTVSEGEGTRDGHQDTCWSLLCSRRRLDFSVDLPFAPLPLTPLNDRYSSWCRSRRECMCHQGAYSGAGAIPCACVERQVRAEHVLFPVVPFTDLKQVGYLSSTRLPSDFKWTRDSPPGKTQPGRSSSRSDRPGPRRSSYSWL